MKWFTDLMEGIALFYAQSFLHERHLTSNEKGEKIYQCTTCNKWVSQKYLVHHMKIYTGKNNLITQNVWRDFILGHLTDGFVG